ncbi:MAG: hypothetical protein KAR01_12930, partial [Desulfocapsa sp.]|nr:hypothetical protein [Desulfocapsa sp.]
MDTLVATNLIDTSNKGLSCNAKYVEEITCQAVFDKSFDKIANAVESVISTKHSWDFEHTHSNYHQALRNIRLALYRKEDRTTVIKFLNYAMQIADDYYERRENPIITIFVKPLNKSLLFYLDEEVAALILSSTLVASSLNMTPLNNFLDLFKELRSKNTILREHTHSILLYQHLLRGEFTAITTMLSKTKEIPSGLTYMAFLQLMTGNHKDAIFSYEISLDALAADNPRPQVFFPHFAGIFYLVALICDGSDTALKKGITYTNRVLKKRREYTFPSAMSDLKQTLLVRQGEKGKAGKISNSTEFHIFDDYLSMLIGYVSLYWQGETAPNIDEEHLKKLLNHAESAKYYWIALQTAGLLNRISDNQKHQKTLIRLQKKCSKSLLLVDLITPEEKWQQVLHALLTLDSKSDSDSSSSQAKSRLIWLVTFYDDEYYEEIKISPRLQKLNKS